jgi:hypothetical protein
MRVTSKGQVTIPKPLREAAGVRLRGKPGPTRGEKLVAALRGTATRNRHMSTDEIMKLLRGDD